MKKIALIAYAFLLSGCTLDGRDVHDAVEFCRTQGGVSVIGVSTMTVSCNNGVNATRQDARKAIARRSQHVN